MHSARQTAQSVLVYQGSCDSQPSARSHDKLIALCPRRQKTRKKTNKQPRSICSPAAKLMRICLGETASFALRRKGGLVRRRSAREGPVCEPPPPPGVINYFACDVSTENSSFAGHGRPRKNTAAWNKQTRLRSLMRGRGLTSQGAHLSGRLERAKRKTRKQKKKLNF